MFYLYFLRERILKILIFNNSLRMLTILCNGWCTVSENTSGATKKRNNYNAILLFIFIILNTYLKPFTLAPHLDITLPTFYINIFASFLYWFCTLVYGFFSVLFPIYYSSSNFCNKNYFHVGGNNHIRVSTSIYLSIFL